MSLTSFTGQNKDIKTGGGQKLERFWGQIVAFWQKLTPGQRKSIIGIAGIVAIALSFSVFFMGKTEYVTLYSNIDPSEAGRITDRLDAWKQEYTLSGTTIKVPVEDRDRLRLKLASEDLAPNGGISGYEIFDVTRLAITDYERRINFLRALQGELRRTIETIDGVEEARVLLVLPRRELFTEDEKQVTASIKLRLSPHTILTKNQIKGIINLVASAVEGLDPEKVTIIDNNGNTLSDMLKQEDAGLDTVLAAKQLELQRSEAKKIELMILKKLSRVLTRDAIEVFVKWEMNFNSEESKREEYRPFKIVRGTETEYPQLKVSDESIKEEFTGVGKMPGGPPGVESQIPGYKEATSQEMPMKYKKDEARNNYLVDKEETRVVKSPDISKISVAVVVDGTYQLDKNGDLKRDEKTGLPVYVPRSAKELKKFENLVWAAIGGKRETLYSSREYIVTVENVQFDRTAEWAADLARRKAQEEKIVFLAIMAGVIILLLLVGLILLFIHRRRIMEREAFLRQLEIERAAALRREQEAREAAARAAAAQAEREEEVGEEAGIGIEIPESHLLILKLVQENPELVAEAFKSWLYQE